MLMVAIVALVMVFMLTASRLTMEQDMQRRIVDGVKDNRNDVKYNDDTIQAGGGFRYYVNGVYCVIYGRTSCVPTAYSLLKRTENAISTCST